MKRRIIPVFILFALLLYMNISCKSSPAPDPAPPRTVPGPSPIPEISVPDDIAQPIPPEIIPPVQVPEPQVSQEPEPQAVQEPELQVSQEPQKPELQAALEILNEAMARAEEARKRAIDFEVPAYFPSDWDSIEEQFNTAGNMPRASESDIQAASDLFNSASDAYDDLFMKTIPLYAQAKEDEILSAREELINSGFTRFFPEYLLEADKKALEALDQFDSGDFYAARDTAAGALDEYQTLLLGARILSARQEIVNRGFTEYDQDNFNNAEKIAGAAAGEYEAGNKKEAVAKAEEALLLYDSVLANGWRSYAIDRRKYALLERESAIKEKANIASGVLFNEADTVFNQAERDFSSENFQDAAISFADSEARFVISRHDTEERRQRALETIRIAEEMIEESNETAIGADKVIEGVLR